jgi:hypothetical protein
MDMNRRGVLLKLLGASAALALPVDLRAQERHGFASALAERLRETYALWGLNARMLQDLARAPVIDLNIWGDFHTRFGDEFGIQGDFRWELRSGRTIGVRTSAWAAFGARSLYSDLNLHELLSMRHSATYEICSGPVIPVGIRQPVDSLLIDSYRKAVANSARMSRKLVSAPHYSREFRNGSGDKFVGTFGRFDGAWRTHWERA